MKGGGKEGEWPNKKGKKEDMEKSDTANYVYTPSQACPIDVAFTCMSDFTAAATALKIPPECQGAIVDSGTSWHFSPA